MDKNNIKPEVKPAYYDSFHCIGGRCDFTCCQEWKIGVDDATYQRWKKIDYGYKTISSYTGKKDGDRVIKLDENGQCPFLDKNGLCSLVIAHGDQILSHTCDIFPREIHEFENVRELTLMPCCPEVIDLMNQGKRFEVIGGCEESEFQKLRRQLMEVMQAEDCGLTEALLTGFYYLQEYANGNCIKDYLSSPIYCELLTHIRKMTVSEEDCLYERNELFLDLLENYRREGRYLSYIEPLCRIAEEKEEDMAGLLACQEDFQKTFAEYKSLLHKWLAQEMFADLLLPEADMDNIFVHYEWICMEFTLIWHICFLTFVKEKNLTYKQVRDAIVLGSRMMGYEDADIQEYMENSFEDTIWEWGYLALLLG